MVPNRQWKIAFAATILAAISGSGCSGGSSTYQPKPPPKVEETAVKEGVDQNLWPFAEGNQWTYEVADASIIGGKKSSGVGELTLKVAKVEKGADEITATIDLAKDGKAIDRQVWLANSKGIYQLSAGLRKVYEFRPMEALVTFPLKEGPTSTWKGLSTLPGGTYGENTVETKVLGMQPVDTASDTVTALAIQQSITYKIGKNDVTSSSLIYLSPGIGMARFYQKTSVGNNAGVELWKLKSHSFK